jgi:hypothetical protein
MLRLWSRSSRKVVDSLFWQKNAPRYAVRSVVCIYMRLKQIYSLLFVIMVNLQGDQYRVGEKTSSNAYIVVWEAE